MRDTNRSRRVSWLTILGPAALLAVVVPFAGADEMAFGLMQPDQATLERWVHEHSAAPLAHLDREVAESMPGRGSFSLLDRLEYTPSQRNQGNCGNCWVWAGTGVLGIALDAARVSDRLSIQYLDSCYLSDWACCGGWLSDLAGFYSTVGQAVPWCNTNAHFQDASRSCGSGSSSCSCGSIFASPHYDIQSINATTIPASGVPQATAISNIKNVLHQGKAVWLAFYLANSSDWGVFHSFWWGSPESAVWNPDYACGHTYLEDEGGGHAVLVVGYDDNDPNPANHSWLVLNSWGASANRPNGVFRMAMNIDYSCTFVWGGWPYDSYYWETLDVAFGELPVHVDGFGCGSTSGWSVVQP